MRRRRILHMAGAGVAVAILTSCSTVCSAVGYVSKADLHVTGEVARVAQIVACVEDLCSLRPEETSDSAYRPTVSGGERGEWTIDFDLTAPDEVVVTALDSAGAEIATESFPIEWTRTGGSESCGGPHETPPIEFVVS